MKKFKLIREYPGSPKLGTEINENGFDDKMTTWCNPKNYPEFWQPVIEKDYEILSFINKQNNEIYYPYKHDSNIFIILDPVTFQENAIGKRNIEYCLKFYNIHSIKRLSDGEIFTIGDLISLNNVSNYYPIETLTICNNTILIDGYINGIKYYKKKSKQKLFTSEDGVDIFEGDEYFELITPNFHNKPCIWNILPCETRSNINYDQKGNKEHGRIWFSTKEKAKEYILMNKSCLSLNEVYSIMSKYRSKSNSLIELKELVKQKLNNKN